MSKLNPADVDDKKSPKQEAFIFKLLNSSVFTKKEFEQIFRFALPNLKTSYGASQVINYLTSAIDFRKAFFPKRCRARKKCSACGNKADLKRYYSKYSDSQIILCEDCDKVHNMSFSEPIDVVKTREEKQSQAQKLYAEQRAKKKKFGDYVDEEEGLTAKQEDDMLETARETIEEEEDEFHGKDPQLETQVYPAIEE